MVLTTLLVGAIALASRSARGLPSGCGRGNRLVELVFFAANAMKFSEGGWFPLACGVLVFTMLYDVEARGKRGVPPGREDPRPGGHVSGDVRSRIPRVEGTASIFRPTPNRSRRCSCTT